MGVGRLCKQGGKDYHSEGRLAEKLISLETHRQRQGRGDRPTVGGMTDLECGETTSFSIASFLCLALESITIRSIEEWNGTERKRRGMRSMVVPLSLHGNQCFIA